MSSYVHYLREIQKEGSFLQHLHFLLYIHSFFFFFFLQGSVVQSIYKIVSFFFDLQPYPYFSREKKKKTLC